MDKQFITLFSPTFRQKIIKLFLFSVFVSLSADTPWTIKFYQPKSYQALEMMNTPKLQVSLCFPEPSTRIAVKKIGQPPNGFHTYCMFDYQRHTMN